MLLVVLLVFFSRIVSVIVLLIFDDDDGDDDTTLNTSYALNCGACRLGNKDVCLSWDDEWVLAFGQSDNNKWRWLVHQEVKCEFSVADAPVGHVV